MDDFDRTLQKRLETDPEFRRLWNEEEVCRQTGLAIIKARCDAGLSQRELSKATGIAQGDISKLETGNTNPSLKTLSRVAEGLGLGIKVVFEPTTKANAQI